MGFAVVGLSLSLVSVAVWLSVWIARLKDQVHVLDQKRVSAEGKVQALETETKQIASQRDSALKAFEDLAQALAETPDDASSIVERLRRNFP